MHIHFMQTVLYFLSLHLFTSSCIHNIEKMNNSRFVLYFSFTEIWPPIWFLSSLRRKGHSSKNSNFSFFAFFKWIPHIERLNLFSPTEPNAEVGFSDKWNCFRCLSLSLTSLYSSPEPLVQYQPNLAQNILGWTAFKFFQMDGRVPSKWK